MDLVVMVVVRVLVMVMNQAVMQQTIFLVVQEPIQ
jgi:hypothetical protein